MEYLIVDGYNVINAWNDIFNIEENSLEDYRMKLLDILSKMSNLKQDLLEKLEKIRRDKF